MTTNVIANRMYNLYHTNKYRQAFKELYDTNILSVLYSGQTQTITNGKFNLLEKLKEFKKQVDVIHNHKIFEPIVNNNHFILAMEVDVTMKGKKRKKVKEIGVYEVKNGKIIKEEFFSSMAYN
jgi:limonene-1,2-epoxide hydrolase